MVQGYAQKDRRGNSGWQTFGGFFGHGSKRSPGVCIGYPFTCPDIGGDTHEQQPLHHKNNEFLARETLSRKTTI